MHAVIRDLRYGFRGLVKEPGFALLAIFALALGIGAATSIFSVIYNVLLNPFPYTDAHRVVAIQIRDSTSSRPGGRTGFQTPEFLDYQEQMKTFEDVIGGGFEDVLYTTGEGTEQFAGGMVTPNTFRFLGLAPLYGRAITGEDAKPGAPPVFVMSHKLWRNRFNMDSSIIGRSFTLNGVPTTLIGIMPRRFTKMNADIYRPYTLDRANPQLNSRYWMFQARLKPGVDLQEAEAEAGVVAQRVAKTYPKNYPKQFNVKVISWVDSLVGGFRKTLYTLAAAVGLLLLIACTNVANMLLARATAREKEIAIRSSLGATRARVVGQLLSESLLLAVAGAAVGTLFAYAGLKGLVAVIPEGIIPREAEISLNIPVLLFSLGIAGFTAVLFGLVPALQAAKRDIIDPLKDSGKGTTGGFRKGRLRNTLVVAEVALSLVLLAGAGLLMRSFIALQTVELGINPENVLVARLPLPRGQYDTIEKKQGFFRPLLQRLQSLPGVVAATETTTLPPYGGIGSEIDVPGSTHSERWDAIFQLCSEGYFPTLGIRLQRGRLLSEADVNDRRKVAVINQTMVAKYFNNQDPIGRMVRIKMMETLPDVKDPSFEVIGVVSDAKNSGIQDPIRPEMFIPYTITGAFERGILVRTSTEPLSMLNSVRREIWAVDRNVALTFTGSLEGFLKQFSYAEPRFTLILLGIFAGVGLLLVTIGVYSVVSYTVSRQTQEIGLRMALGAGRPDVFKMVLGLGGKLLGIGILAGVAISLGATRVLSTQLWNISPNDPLTLAVVALVVLAVGCAACYFPARRAMRVDPMVALRYE